MDHTFAIVTRDGLWRDGSMIEERLSSGVAEQRGRVIKASDALDAELARACDARFEEIVRAVGPAKGRIRGIAFARRVVSEHGEDVFTSAVITFDGLVVTPEAGVIPSATPPPRSLATLGMTEALLWSHGSVSVLLHEAIGHAAEEGAPPIAWPAWLQIRDEPPFRLDDAGQIARTSNLLFEKPASLRRATFKDVPIPRMSRVIIEGEHAFELPKKYVEVQLASGGRYDPLTDRVSVAVSRAVDESGEAVAPFVIRTTRERIRAAILGARGESIRYPGVICSSDGQKLVVECFAPAILTSELS